jgi:3-dehydrotetronate 4-kinase
MEQEKGLIIGCIADEFNGSMEAAAGLHEAGLCTALVHNVPKAPLGPGYEAIVTALDLRGIAPSEAVQKSLASLQWLRQQGAQHIYIQCGSTVPAIRAGNIPLLIDAILEAMEETCTIFCPAMPEKGRYVRNGVLSLEEPLGQEGQEGKEKPPADTTDLDRLLTSQGKYDCMKLPQEFMERASAAEVRKKIRRFAAENERFYIVPDYSEEAQAGKIAELFAAGRLLAGSSSLLPALGRHYKNGHACKLRYVTGTTGKGIVFVGSCAPVVMEQIIAFRNAYGSDNCYKLKPMQLISGEQSIESICDWIRAAGPEVLIYSSEPLEAVQENQRVGNEKMFGLFEKTMSELALRAVQAGFTRLVIAGDETAAAILPALGYATFDISGSVIAGVPVLTPLLASQLRIVLKYGSQGGLEFFSQALHHIKV